MRAWLVVVAVAGLGVQDPAPRPHGPYADRDGWVCHQGDTVDRAKRVHCWCKMPCDNDGVEDRRCQTYCAGLKCLCHTDSSCGPR
jgi:hypothetical protein